MGLEIPYLGITDSRYDTPFIYPCCGVGSLCTVGIVGSALHIESAYITGGQRIAIGIHGLLECSYGQVLS